ncbi:MAG: hypothetical protein ACTSRI_00310 [Promethearchaeota archaeon]
MAVTKINRNVEMPNEYKKIRIICPICKAKKELDFHESNINQAKQLTTISISKGLICKHQFQAFIDKHFKVRGYQKVDFEFENKNNIEKETDLKNFKRNDDSLFEHLIMEGNYLEYKPKELDKVKTANNANKVAKPELKKKKMTLQEIYDEFWEFIDDDNEEFREFIIKDARRKFN